jgi:signal peptidase I
MDTFLPGTGPDDAPIERSPLGSHDHSGSANPPESGSAASEGPRPSGASRKSAPAGSVWKELPVLIVIAILLAILLKTFLVQAFFIPSGSMENTLHVYDRVMVNKVVYHLRDIKRGDVVVFNGLDSWTPEVTIAPPTNPVAKALAWFEDLVGFAPASEKDFIKRVIGIPGDRVACCDAGGRVTVNGVALNEPYVYPGNTPSDATFHITVPAGRLWVMGDHRADSSDSRYNGTIPEDEVIGRAFVVIWPVGHWSWLSNPSTFDQSGLTAAAGSAAAVPLAPSGLTSPLMLGFVGAAPIVAGRRRWRARHHLRRAGLAVPRREHSSATRGRAGGAAQD